MRGIAASRQEQVIPGIVRRLSGRGRRAFARHRVEQFTHGCLRLFVSSGRSTIGVSLDHRCPFGVGRLVPPRGLAVRRV